MRLTKIKWFILAALLAPIVLNAQETALPLYDLPDPFLHDVSTSGSLAQTRAGRYVVANMLTDTVSIIGRTGTIEAEIPAGNDPRGVTVTADNLRALALSRGDGTLIIIDLETNAVSDVHQIGSTPYHIVADAATAYISLQDSAEVVSIDIETGVITQRIRTPDYPAALALWGDFLYVTHFWTGELSLIFLPAGEVVRTIRPNPESSLSQSIEIDPFAGLAFLPQSLSNNDLLNATADNRLIPVVQVVDLSTMMVDRSINLVVADRHVNMPFAAAQPANRSRLYVAHAGSDAVTVLDLDRNVAEAHFETGANPRALMFNSAFTQVVVHDALDNTLSLVGTRFLALDDSIPTSAQAVTAGTQIGARLFHTANDSRLSRNHAISCASCHFDAGSDGRRWQNRRTPALNEVTNFESAFIEQHIQSLQNGRGLGETSLDMLALLDYLRTGGE